MEDNVLPILTVTLDYVIYPLPHQRALIEKLRKNPERQEALMKLIKERKGMNFEEAVESTKNGNQVRRPTWDKNMFMWWSGSYCVHTHPYFDFQTKSPSLTGYLYVVEKDDAIAQDWEMATA